ncbi:MAG: dihydrolipoyl dehydrogenase [Desulfuromonas sp.]|nr:MAG: dihydrolipoyl dehydrogenase [Desulfuromonas sp.]
MEQNKDVIIIGAGSAGLAALREVRKQTDNFLIINAGHYGTTCARVGCMPSKALIEAANAYHRRHDFAAFAISGSEQLSIDTAAVMRRVRSLRDRFVGGVLKSTEGLGERSIAGHARFLGPNCISVNGREYSAKRIIIASGSRPIIPEPWQAFGDRILTTDTLFEQEELPRRIAVVGMGVIGVEMAQALGRIGLEVTCFGSNQNLAGLCDPEVATTFAELLGKELPIHTGNRADVSCNGDSLIVTAGDRQVEVDAVLAALGRRPNVADLGLETLGIELDSRGMPSYDPHTMRIGNLPVFFAGDVNGDLPILHEAADEGHIAGRNSVAATCHFYQRRTPLAIVFSDPNVAVVGQRYKDLDLETIIVGSADFRTQGRARTAEKNKGLMRIYAERDSGKLLGAEMCVPGAEHMIHLLALAIEHGMSVADLLRLPFYHPVLEEGLRTALRDLSGQLPSGHESDLATFGSFHCEALD